MQNPCYCEKCGKEMPDGAAAYAVSSGSIQDSADGFMPDNDPYIQVLCDGCGEGISQALALMPVTPAQEHAAELLAALETLLGAAQLAGSGQEQPYTWAEYCEIAGAAIAKAQPAKDCGAHACGADLCGGCDNPTRGPIGPSPTREPAPPYGPTPGAMVRAVVVVTGNGGGLLRVAPVDIPREVWEDEPRGWVDEKGIAGTLDGSEGYELMDAASARRLAAELTAAAGKPPATAGPLIWDGEENTCPICGELLDMEAEELDPSETIGTANWTCPDCGAEGVQVREIIFQYHRDVKAGIPMPIRVVAFTDTAGKAGSYTTSAAKGPGGGNVIHTSEAARLLREHGEALPFDIMAGNYGGEEEDEEDGYTGLTPEDLEEGRLDPDWGPFEVW